MILKSPVGSVSSCNTMPDLLNRQAFDRLDLEVHARRGAGVAREDKRQYGYGAWHLHEQRFSLLHTYSKM
jgi:hypothetical protein